MCQQIRAQGRRFGQPRKQCEVNNGSSFDLKRAHARSLVGKGSMYYAFSVGTYPSCNQYYTFAKAGPSTTHRRRKQEHSDLKKILSDDTPKVHNIPNMFRINAVIWNFLLLILLNPITYSMKRLGQMWTKNVGERCLGIVANESSITDIGIK